MFTQRTNERTKVREKKKAHRIFSVDTQLFLFLCRWKRNQWAPSLSVAVFFFSLLITFIYFRFTRAIVASLLLFQSPKSTVPINSIIHGQWQIAVQYCFKVSGESMVFLFATRGKTYAYIIRTIILLCGCVIRCAIWQCYWWNPCNFCGSYSFKCWKCMLRKWFLNIYDLRTKSFTSDEGREKNRERNVYARLIDETVKWNRQHKRCEDDSEKLLLLCRSQCVRCVQCGSVFFSTSFSSLLCFITAVLQ